MNGHLELWNLVKVLTFYKLVNLLKLYIGFQVSRVLKKPVVWGMPAALSIEPTTSCNLRCPECPSGLRSFSRKTGMLSTENFEHWLGQLNKELIYLSLYFQGEPFLNPGFFGLISVAKRHKTYVSTSTNAHFMSSENARRTVESGLDRLIVSIDGTSQDTYQSYRIGGSLHKVVEGTQNIIYWKKKLGSSTPLVVFQFLAVRTNEHQVEEVKKLGKQLGVDQVTIKKAQINDFENGNPLIPENPDLSRYKKDSLGKYQLKNRMLNQCWRMWHSAVITWDGAVVPCCFDKDAKHKMGELSSTSFKEIWKSQPYNNFRRGILVSRRKIDICKNCTEGTSVYAG